MRTLLCLLVGAVVMGLAIEAEGGEVFTVTPARPTAGDTVRLTYDGSAPGATLGGRSTLRGEALLMPDSDTPVLLPIAMTRSGNRWSGILPLTDRRAVLVLFRVVSEKDQDNGDGNAPFTMVYGKDGKPLMGANVQLGSLLAGGGVMEFKREKDLAAAYASFAREKELYPENWRAYPAEWLAMMRDRGKESRDQIRTALDTYYARFQKDGEAIAAVLSWYARTGQNEKGEEIKKNALMTDPGGPVARAARREALRAEKDTARLAEMIEKFETDFPQTPSGKDELLGLQINAFMAAKAPDRVLPLLDKLSVPSATLCNMIAWDLIEKGKDLEQAVRLAKRAVDLASNPPPGTKPTFLSDEKWEEENSLMKAMVLDTYGFGLYKLGRYADAEPPLRQAFALSNGEQPDITERLMMAYERNGRYDSAVSVGKTAVATGKTNEKLIEQFKTAYTGVNGSDRGFDALLAETRAAGAKEMKEKILKSRLKKPAVQFTLKDLAGKTVRLEDLKGKVVVVDFWATWCGPCKRSFPTLQKVYDLYRKNPDVEILALNTWENVSGKEREDLVKKFMEDNRYTFPVLYDERFVEKYGVEGIPTKFVIDRKGNLAFKTIGFSGADEMFSELTAQIDLLLAE